MSRRTDTIQPDYFETLYREKGDPWGFRTSAYESEKYAATLAALSRPRYPDALEVGCSIGVFTAALASRCDRLLAIDGSPTALEAARAACAAFPQVTLAEAMIPGGFPAGHFTLIVLSEVLYYLTPDDLERSAERCATAQASTGDEIVLCHWLGETDYPQTGADASDRFVHAMQRQGYTATTLADDTYRLIRLLRG